MIFLQVLNCRKELNIIKQITQNNNGDQKIFFINREKRFNLITITYNGKVGANIKKLIEQIWHQNLFEEIYQK